jgi:hypothetical protein
MREPGRGALHCVVYFVILSSFLFLFFLLEGHWYGWQKGGNGWQVQSNHEFPRSKNVLERKVEVDG